MPATFLVDLKNAAVGDASIRPQAALTASANGGGVDFLNADGPVTLIATAGATDFASTDETYVLKLQESDTSGGTYTDISGATVSITAANTTKYVATQLRTKRWVRAVVTIGGTTPSILLTALVLARKKISGTGNGAQTT